MKKTTRIPFYFFLFFFVFLLATFTRGYSQGKKIDSLKQLLAHSKMDTTSSIYLWRIAQTFLDLKKEEDSALIYASKGYGLAEKHEFLRGMWVNLAEQCFVYQHRGNYQKTLRLYLDFLKLCEERKDIGTLTRVLKLISDLYIKLEDYDLALAYSKRNTPAIIESGIGGGWLEGNLYNIGISFFYLHEPDSALAYFQQGFALANRDKASLAYDGWFDQFLVGLGMANQQLGNKDLALAYYDKAIRNEEKYNSEELYFAYMQKAALFHDMNGVDSSIANYSNALRLISGNLNDQIQIYKALANIYLVKDPASSAKYFALGQSLRDSLFTSDKVNAIQTLTYNEEERQKELANAKRDEAEDHKKNIENISITIGIIGFLISFLLLSRSIIVNGKWIRFLGVVGLLVLFEFINLLLHPLLEKLTGHSSIYMLIIMVGIAALLVPLHHRIEKWVTSKMVEKNKQIRLAAAKKTIEQLGG
jgi:tetratricopeptide (TPR) repeat protein